MNILDLILENIVTVSSGVLSLVCSIITIFLKSKSNVDKVKFLKDTIEISLKEINELKLANLKQESKNNKE